MCICLMLLGFCLVVFFFFFSSRRRHTRCSRDWSSDVCSSDLEFVERHFAVLAAARAAIQGAQYDALRSHAATALGHPVPAAAESPTTKEIGRASCRERV